MNIIIRKYKEEDLDDVNKLLKESFNITKNNFNVDNFTELVATISNQVVGYLLLTKIYNPIKDIYYFHIDYVCVLSSYRGLGIGKKLLDYVDELSNQENISYIELTSNYQRIAAHKLYEKCGYIKPDTTLFRKYFNEN